MFIEDACDLEGNVSTQTQSFLSAFQSAWQNSVVVLSILTEWDVLFPLSRLSGSCTGDFKLTQECGLLKVHERGEDKRRAQEHNGSSVPFSRLRALSHFNTLACDCHYRKGFTMWEWRKCCKLLSFSLAFTLTHTHTEIVISIPTQWANLVLVSQWVLIHLGDAVNITESRVGPWGEEGGGCLWGDRETEEWKKEETKLFSSLMPSKGLPVAVLWHREFIEASSHRVCVFHCAVYQEGHMECQS